MAGACSDDDASSTGQGGAANVGGAAATGTGGSSTTTGTGGGAPDCPTGLFDGTSCADFLEGCYAPDTSGTCTDSIGELTWSDGHRIVRTGADAGLYGPGDDDPCITLVFDQATNTATLTNVATGGVMTNQDQGDGTIVIGCPDGDMHTFTSAELEEDNVCKGIACGGTSGAGGGTTGDMCTGAADCPGQECCAISGAQTCLPAGACAAAGGMVVP